MNICVPTVTCTVHLIGTGCYSATQAPSTSQTGHISQDQSAGQGRAQGLQAESSGQAWQMTCYHCRQFRHMRRDCPRRQRSQGTVVEHPEQPDM